MTLRPFVFVDSDEREGTGLLQGPDDIAGALKQLTNQMLEASEKGAISLPVEVRLFNEHLVVTIDATPLDLPPGVPFYASSQRGFQSNN